MAASEDTEITLGTGKMLALFFGLVALCAVFFGMGFSLGKNSGKTNVELQGGTGASAVRPTAVKAAEARAPSDLTFYKAVEQKDPQADLTAKTADTPASSAAKPASADAMRLPIPLRFQARTVISCRWRRSASRKMPRPWWMRSRKSNTPPSPPARVETSCFMCRWDLFPTSRTRRARAASW